VHFAFPIENQYLGILPGESYISIHACGFFCLRLKYPIEEEDDHIPDPPDELLESPKPSIELKPLPSGLRYAFLNNDQDSPVIISNKLSQKESLRLITVLEKHRSAFSYSL
jgi:hypothetical protein